MRRCHECGERKPEERFSLEVKANGTSYRRRKCMDCYNEVRREAWDLKDRQAVTKRERYASDPEYRQRVLSQQHKWKYGITFEEKQAILDSQGGLCAACGASESPGYGWVTDHDHACCPTQRKTCGACIRGVLCTNCNLSLGHAKDSIERLEKLIAYLKRTAVQVDSVA